MCPELCGTKDLLKQQHGHNNKYNHGGDCEPCCVPKFRSAAGESWWVSFMSVDTPNWMVEYGIIWLNTENCRGFPIPVFSDNMCLSNDQNRLNFVRSGRLAATQGWPSLQSFSYVQSSSIKSRSLANMNSSFWWFPRLWPQWRWCWLVVWNILLC